MIRLAWRQHRKQAMFTAVGFAVLAALMIPIALSMRHTFADLGLPNCVRQMAQADVPPATRDACDAAFHRFTNRYGSLNLVAVLLLILPMLVGLFWGAPLVAREVEHGTHRLAWTQGISRTHWALVKFGGAHGLPQGLQGPERNSADPPAGTGVILPQQADRTQEGCIAWRPGVSGPLLLGSFPIADMRPGRAVGPAAP